MKIEYTILAAFIALVYAILVKFLPDIPLDRDMLMTLFVYVLLKLGVEIVGEPIRRTLYRQFTKRG